MKTSSSERGEGGFFISARQLTLAELMGPRFHVVRVLGAGRAHPTIKCITDPVGLWRRGKADVLMVVR